jgi:hypothetical protein
MTTTHTATASPKSGKKRADGSARRFRLGLFGDTRSGKTVYLSALQYAAEKKMLDPKIGFRPDEGESAGYLGKRVAALMLHRWPAGNIAASEICLNLDRDRDTIAIHTADFRGGDFGNANYDGKPADAAEFDATLYDRCDAYIFLIDPGILKGNDANARQRASLAITVALGKLKPLISLFHKPVAIGFTKCDMHPDVESDPAAFAAALLPEVHKYLRRFAPGRHHYFAISATGKIKVSDEGPLEDLQPTGLLDPILWSADAHHHRLLRLKQLVAFCLLLTLLAIYGLLYAHNARQIASIRAQFRSANRNELATLYQETRPMEGLCLFSFTHPNDKIQVRQEIASAAEDCMRQTQWSSDTIDPVQYHARDIDAFKKIQGFCDAYANDYRGNENVIRNSSYLASEKSRLTDAILVELSKAADAGDEFTFANTLKLYEQLPSEQAKPSVQKAARRCAEIYLQNHSLRDIYLLLAKPHERGDLNVEILLKCGEADRFLKQRADVLSVPNPEEDKLLDYERQYVRAVCNLYDPKPFYLSINLTSVLDKQLKLSSITFNGEQPLNLAKDVMLKPVKVENQKNLSIHLPMQFDPLNLKTDAAITIELAVDETRARGGALVSRYSDLFDNPGSLIAKAWPRDPVDFSVAVPKESRTLFNQVLKDIQTIKDAQANLFGAKTGG